MQLGDSDGTTALTFLADNAHLAFGTKDGRICLWNAASGMRVLNPQDHVEWIISLSASPRKPLLASASGVGTVRIWDTSSGVCLFTHNVDAVSLAFFPDGDRLAIGCKDGWLRLWYSSTNKIQPHKLRGVHHPRLAVSNDGKFLAAASFGQSDVVIFNTADFRNPVTELDVGESIGRISFSPDNSQLLIADSYFVRLWEIGSGKCRAFEHENVRNAAFSPDGTRIVSGTEHR